MKDYRVGKYRGAKHGSFAAIGDRIIVRDPYLRTARYGTITEILEPDRVLYFNADALDGFGAYEEADVSDCFVTVIEKGN